METRSKSYLLNPSDDIIGSKLPSIGQVLSFFLQNHLVLKLTVSQSAIIVIDKVMTFWNKAQIPVQDVSYARKKVMKLFEDWRLLKKNTKRASTTQRNSEAAFQERLETLFDIAHKDALLMMKNPEDKAFLIAQREPGRRGSMGPVDMKLESIKKRRANREERQEQLKEKAVIGASAELSEHSSSTDNDDESPDCEPEHLCSSTRNVEASATSVTKRGRKIVLTQDLSGFLDRHKISDRAAAGVIAEAANSVGMSIEKLSVNRSTIRRQRIAYRKEQASSSRESFVTDLNDHPLVVHWDSKMMPDLTGKERADRLPILVSGDGETRLLSVPRIANGTGHDQATAVANVLKDMKIVENVKAMCFDTTAANTGRHSGACIRLEQFLEKDLYWIACRHHILELVLSAAFTSVMGFSSGPEVPLFKRFLHQWEFIDRSRYEEGIDENLASVANEHEEILHVLMEYVEHDLPRDDYREIAELAIILLGSTPPRGIKFLSPGPIHHARWMAKAIYTMKIFIFRHQFRLTQREDEAIRKLVTFLLRIYIKNWISAPKAAWAPMNDLKLCQELSTYDDVDIKSACTSKIASHLWYLSEDLIGLSIFDERVSETEKEAIVRRMKQIDGEENAPKRVTVNMSLIHEKKLSDFTTRRSKAILQDFQLSDSFLDVSPSQWEGLRDFECAKRCISNLCVTNDNAERGVALIQEYNGRLTKDEDQLQCLLSVVSEHRKRYPDCSKATILSQQKK